MKFKYFKTIIFTIFIVLFYNGCSSQESFDPVNDIEENITVCNGIEITPERLFLQQLSDESVIIKWRGDATKICIGTDDTNLSMLVEGIMTEQEHKEAQVVGLQPDTRYYYSIGGASSAPLDQTFKTAPTLGYPKDDNNTRIWVLGDSGSAGYTHIDADATSSEPHADKAAYEGLAEGVRLGMEKFTQADGEDIDIFLMLGDNAYNNGDEQNYQAAVFETYPSELKRVALWPTIGNHEMGVAIPLLPTPAPAQAAQGGMSTVSDLNQYYIDGNAVQSGSPSLMPYMEIFTLPTSGEAGGVASGTEQYYSFDYGNVHIVSLDSQLSARDTIQRATMKSWLQYDLQSTTADWIIVIFHHPPYSKGGNHDSDFTSPTAQSVDKPQIDMRNEFVSLFQQYGVDLVLNGHAHSYERSYYLKDLYTDITALDVRALPTAGDSVMFDATVNAYNAGTTGRPSVNEEYTETDSYVVYAVAGNGGKADHDGGIMLNPMEWLNHKAMVEQPYYVNDEDQVSATSTDKQDHTNGLSVPGSLLIDANAVRLDVRMVDANGTALDRFVIKK